jgi:hypothetical protein
MRPESSRLKMVGAWAALIMLPGGFGSQSEARRFALRNLTRHDPPANRLSISFLERRNRAMDVDSSGQARLSIGL